jgi:hypothetical protein
MYQKRPELSKETYVETKETYNSSNEVQATGFSMYLIDKRDLCGGKKDLI